MMSYLTNAHRDFVHRAIVSSLLLPDQVMTGLPSLIFFLSGFVMFYLHLHRTTGLYTRWKTRLTRELKFQWIYFNATRLWFILLSCVRRLVAIADDHIEHNLPEDDQQFNKVATRGAALVVVMSISLIPVLLLYINCVTRNDMPNFLMWVMEDPYLRHEIGISGHCLDHPLRADWTLTKNLKNCAYRSRRSTSFDTQPWENSDPKRLLLCRNCRSMMEHSVVKSINDLILEK